MSRELTNSILTKFGVATPEAFNDERAEKKLGNRLAKEGAPAGLTDEEKAHVTSLGFSPDSAPAGSGDVEPDAKPAKVAKGKAKTPAKEKSAFPHSDSKAAKAKAKGGKATTRDKTPAKDKPATKTAKTPKEKTERKSTGGAALFKSLLEGGKVIKKAAVIERLTAAGIKPGTANSYIVWAKRPLNMGKDKNPFGFRIVETKDEKTSEKSLQRKGAGAKD